MRTYLGLGSNLGDRNQNLTRALEKIQSLCEPGSLKLSSLYETPALLPENAPEDWNKPFLNLAVEGEFSQPAEKLLSLLQNIEKDLGRGPHSVWAPRSIDIDLLFYGEEKIETPRLKIPHPAHSQRAFVLDPLKDLAPRFYAQSKAHPQHSPIWMGVINVTPDSFSDGGNFRGGRELQASLDDWDSHYVGMIDVGGESTRPGATPVGWQEEWRRIKPILEELDDRYRGRILKPIISVDTRHAKTASRALEMGVGIINDVSGLSDPEMIAVLKGSSAQYVLMHSIGIPANRDQLLPEKCDPVLELLSWFQRKAALLESSGIIPERIIIDPGIGFGKSALQSLEIMRNLSRFQELPYRLLVGHSRKSFLNPFTRVPAPDRDLESIGASLNLITQGADILRVHNPVVHIRAFRAWNHLNRSHS